MMCEKPTSDGVRAMNCCYFFQWVNVFSTDLFNTKGHKDQLLLFWKIENRLCRLSNRLLYFRRRVIMNEYAIMSFHDVR